MKSIYRSVKLFFIAVVLAAGFGCSTDSGSSNQKAQSLKINKEDILLKVNGICGQSRNYGLLESNLIELPDGSVEIKQLIFLENGNYIQASEIFQITQKGKNLFSYSNRTENIKTGSWTSYDGGVSFDEAVLNYRDGNRTFTLTNLQNKNESFNFRRIEKVSDQFIPQSYGCPNQSEIVAKSSAGKFAVQIDHNSELIRYTPKEENLLVLRGDVESTSAGDQLGVFVPLREFKNPYLACRKFV